MKCIIYCRKSTDRDDKQANSLEHQLNNCRNTVKNLGLTLVKEIVESVSAKVEFKRNGFNEMIEMCKKKQIDFIVIDEPKRLSRNNIDTSRIIDLMDKKQIRWIYATSRQYLSDNSRDKFLLQLDLSLSKMDNEDRSADIKSKMLTCAKRWQCLIKAPFWYKNITIKKGHKSVEVVPAEAKVVKDMFDLRANGFSYSEISKILATRYPKMHIFASSTISNILHNKFYIGITIFSKQEFKWEHTPIISQKLFQQVQKNSKKGIHSWKYDRNIAFPLKGFVKDSFGGFLHAYKSKGYSYYKSNNKNTEPLNIREEIILEKTRPFIAEIDKNFKNFTQISEKIIEDIANKHAHQQNIALEKINKDLENQNNKISSLLDLRLDREISNEIFEKKNEEISQIIQKLHAEKEEILSSKQSKFSKITQQCLELSKSLSESYNRGDKFLKIEILKNVCLELFITTKKELKIKENKLFEMIKFWFFPSGGSAGTRTQDLKLKRLLL